MVNKDTFKEKFQELFNTCQDELKKTTALGKKMLSASVANTQLKETYEDLGKELVNALKAGDLTWENEKVKELVIKVDTLCEQLDVIEDDVAKIKKAETDEH